MEKLIITVALTGNVPTKQMNPHLPLTPDEIAAYVRIIRTPFVGLKAWVKWPCELCELRGRS